MIALDTNIFIYVLEGNSQFGHRAADLLSHAQGTGVASMFVYLEVLSHPTLARATSKHIALSFLDEQKLEYIEMSKELLVRAAHLRASLTPKVGVGDSLHLASALHAGADTFITNDQALVKLKTKGLKIVSL